MGRTWNGKTVILSYWGALISWGQSSRRRFSAVWLWHHARVWASSVAHGRRIGVTWLLTSVRLWWPLSRGGWSPNNIYTCCDPVKINQVNIANLAIQCQSSANVVMLIEH
jgi:hypothetical protein